jgi:cytochrome c-type biogenesis protein CcmH
MSSYIQLQRPEKAKEAFDLALAAYPTGPDADALRQHAGTLGIAGGLAPDAGGAAQTMPGPTQEDIAAAQNMTPEERAEFIYSMLQRRESKLVDEGGLAEDWLRLITMYVEQGHRDDAARLYKIAYAALENDPSQGFVKEQALLMGLPVE